MSNRKQINGTGRQILGREISSTNRNIILASGNKWRGHLYRALKFGDALARTGRWKGGDER